MDMAEKKRFTMEKSEGQDTIYDWEGLDDYYHLGNDTRDVKDLCDLLNEQDNEIKQLETRCQHHEHNLKHYQKEKENLTNMIKNQINEINHKEYLSDHDKILAIHQLKWVLSIIDSGANESYHEKEVVHFGKAIDEICSHLTYPPEDK